MKYASAPAFRDALEQRLRTQTRESGVSLMRLRKRVAFERFLARLVVAAPDRWVLKGAFALDVRLGLRTRATKDIDLARTDDEQAATEDLVAAAAPSISATSSSSRLGAPRRSTLRPASTPSATRSSASWTGDVSSSSRSTSPSLRRRRYRRSRCA